MPPKRGGKAPAFPAARVKRIMQQDDDVGKVATASPIVMAKATELFLQEMLTAIEKEARAKATKKVTLYHVKRAVENAASLDFLKDLVSSIPDPAGADEGDESGDTTKPKKRAPRAAAAKGAAAAAAKAEGSASPAMHGTQSPLSAAASTSTSASGLKKIKISHQASNISSGMKTEETMVPSTSSMSEPGSTTTTSAPPPLSPSKVAIPISSLLNSSTEDYDDAPAFGATEQEEDVKPAVTAQRGGMEEDDNHDDEDVGATQNGGDAIAPAPNGDASMQASAPEETPSTRPALQRGEEDDNYDDD